MTTRPWEVERDRFGTMFSGPLEVGECIEVVPASWDGLLMILDRHYPSDVFNGSSGDPGPRIIALTRGANKLLLERDQARKALEKCRFALGTLNASNGATRRAEKAIAACLDRDGVL